MHIAAEYDHAFSITFLKARGISVDVEDNSGKTPMHYACKMGADEAIYYLLAWTQDINHQDN